MSSPYRPFLTAALALLAVVALVPDASAGFFRRNVVRQKTVINNFGVVPPAQVQVNFVSPPVRVQTFRTFEFQQTNEIFLRPRFQQEVILFGR